MKQERLRAFELEKIRMENETKAKENAQIKRAKTEAAKGLKRLRRLNECDYKRKQQKKQRS